MTKLITVQINRCTKVYFFVLTSKKFGEREVKPKNKGSPNTKHPRKFEYNLGCCEGANVDYSIEPINTYSNNFC